jgi:hypothetical protein
MKRWSGPHPPVPLPIHVETEKQREGQKILVAFFSFFL